MSDQAIIDAFEARVLEFVTDPETPFSWPGRKFKEPSSGLWIAYKLFPQRPRSLGSSSGSSKQYRGYLQATIVCHEGKGIQRSGALADLIAAHFPYALEMQSSGLTVTITQPPGVDSVFEDKKRVKMVVPIFYSARD